MLNSVKNTYVPEDRKTKEDPAIMIVKPAVTWLGRVKPPVLRGNIVTILTCMSENTDIYPNPSPPLAQVQAALDDFVNCIAAKVDGGRTATLAKATSRKVLTDLVRKLAIYVQMACQGDLSNLEKSGFPKHKPVRQAVGLMPRPQGLWVKHGPQLSQLTAGVKPVPGVVNYNWRITAQLPGAVPVIEQDTASTHTFKKLTGGVNYIIEACVLGTAGLSDWTGPATMFAD
jgi:hypothetical protein